MLGLLALWHICLFNNVLARDGNRPYTRTYRRTSINETKIDERACVKSVFDIFDSALKKDGKLTLFELYMSGQTYGGLVSEKPVRNAMKMSDKNADGFTTEKEYLEATRKYGKNIKRAYGTMCAYLKFVEHYYKPNMIAFKSMIKIDESGNLECLYGKNHRFISKHCDYVKKMYKSLTRDQPMVMSKIEIKLGDYIGDSTNKAEAKERGCAKNIFDQVDSIIKKDGKYTLFEYFILLQTTKTRLVLTEKFVRDKMKMFDENADGITTEEEYIKFAMIEKDGFYIKAKFGTVCAFLEYFEKNFNLLRLDTITSMVQIDASGNFKCLYEKYPRENCDYLKKMYELLN